MPVTSDPRVTGQINVKTEITTTDSREKMTWVSAQPLPITGYGDIDEFLDECFRTMRDKGHDYRQGNDADVLHNFRTVAESVGSDMEKVWFTYFYKHYSAMVTYIKEGGQRESEPIEGRIKDQIVYLILFWKMVQEKKANSLKKSVV
jgi:hypothetical protein